MSVRDDTWRPHLQLRLKKREVYDNISDDYIMGLLFSLMVFGDSVAEKPEADTQLRRHLEAGTSSPKIQYRTNPDDEGNDWEDDDTEEVFRTESSDTGLVTLRTSRHDAAATSIEHCQDGNYSKDGSGLCSEIHYEPSALESWSCIVHTNRAGLDEEATEVMDDSGGQRGRYSRDEDQQQLMQIMNITNRSLRLQSLQRYLSNAEVVYRPRMTMT